MVLSKEEQIQYNGGGKISIGIAALFVAIGSFIFGLIDGLSNPQVCNR